MTESAPASSAFHSRSDYKAPEMGSVMESKILVSEQDIINTYSQKDKISCQKYFEYLKLVQDNPTIGYKKAAKLLGVKQGSTRWWHTKGEKRAIPNPLKVVQKLKEAGLLPFTEDHKDTKIIFNILGTLFGDGGIDCRFNTVAFISADKRDVDLWHEDLLKIFPFAQGKTQIVEGGEYGHSYNIRCYDRAVVRFFAALGAPVGDKITTIYSLPKWIFDSSEESRTAFLDGYLASEMSVPRWRPDSRGHYRFTDFSIGISKDILLEKEHKEFLQSVEKLLKSVGVETTGNIYKDTSSGCLRKDGVQTAGYRIFIRTTFHRVLFFDKKFSLYYAQDKKKRTQEVIATAQKAKNAKYGGESMP
jgi:ATP-dependent Lon protease